jgi:type IV secretion system protein VirB10
LRQLAATVPQGTLIPAVLETALDSTRPGYVRALVTRDVRGFDGSRVLIPRGTRLFGEYEADLAPGQNRALVRWIRLVRPDGTAVAVDSPAADALGRAGVEGRVNNHFPQRFASALLQSTVSIGLALATREIGDNALVVALPGAAQNGTGTTSPGQVQPTLRVAAGATVTVFVAHDLNLPPVETTR